ncbi:solute carrier family 66 member 3-like [Acipenser oxyrinchus oxyrinchus]|uniref:Solute carrier family 66 member 3 n=1 Tax=Acipenser oxyrinchus oxyrinchus TaxID=40147 RepID=A0AAD8GCM7_ACIOX|nr:solute carrier family 66 member 3-like [Acipenser oxyrinchus oxyrinchus]
MSADLVLHFANFSTLFVCLVLKFPQIFALVSAKSSRGISLKSLLLELTGFIVVLSYQSYYEYPLSAYLEYPILIAQDVILLLLVFYYNGNLSHCLLPAVLFFAVWPLITFQKWIIDLAMSLCTFISAASKFAQLQCLWETRDAGQVSALTWGMAIYTSSARIFTTLMTTGDFQVLARFFIMLLFNGWVTATIVYYRRAGEKQE